MLFVNKLTTMEYSDLMWYNKNNILENLKNKLTIEKHKYANP